MTNAFLDAAARAHALVCLADGRVAWPEANGFAGAMTGDTAFAAFSRDEMMSASKAAFAGIDRAQAMETIADEIAAMLSSPAEREAVIRAARRGLAADGVRREQEDAALAALAAALSMDVSKA